MKASQLVETAIDIAKNYKTLYILGCFGAPMSDKNKKRYTKNNEYNKKRADMINAASSNTFGWDCCGLIKGICWNWCGDVSKTYGGATYQSNGVPDIGANAMIKKCNDVSTDFSKIIPGEVCWIDGHISIYIGDGFCVEATPKWDNKVQISVVSNIFPKSTDVKKRTWTKHGKLPWVDYSDVPAVCPMCGRPL